MKKKRSVCNIGCRLTALLLALAVSLGLTLPVLAAEDDGYIHISSGEEFLEFAEQCALDTWSQGKTVVLDRDISLGSAEFSPAASFGGTFDGGGHTISGLYIEGGAAPAGLFGVLQEGAVVKNLQVSGEVKPSGSREQVGGIAGVNDGSILDCSFYGVVQGETDTGGIVGVNRGRILSCTAGGSVSGELRTGGIAGDNSGTIISCTNDSRVNTASTEPTRSLDDIGFDFTLDLENLDSAERLGAASDTGGIAGYSSGSIMGCENTAVIGYQHVGYNVGGIAGRSCGHLSNCRSSGEIYGRKDVGGIVGQAEPYIITNLSASTLAKLEEQLDALNALTNQALNDVEDSGSAISARLNQLSEYVNSAADAAKNIQTTISMDGAVIGSGSATGGGSATVTPPSVEVEGEGDYRSDTSIGVELPGGAETGAGTEADGGAEVQGTAAVAPEGSVVTLQAGAASIQAVPLDVTVERDGGADGSGSVGATPGTAEASGGAEASGSVYASGSATANTNLSGISAAVNGIAGQLQLLGGEADNMSDTLLADMRAINEQFEALTDTLFEAADAFQGGDGSGALSDTSAVDIDAVTYGKAKHCTNTGTVYGDINVGGIAGAMSIEYAFDPEDDVTENISSQYKREYELKAILQECVNRGEVVSKKNCAGGLCGRMDLGLILDGESYGRVESENGSYVGGVAGLTNATVWKCYVKCSLAGKDDIGGIVGSGVTDSVTGSSSLVAQCYAMVEIEAAEQYAGAVSGCDAGGFWENYFVSDTLAGIDRLSRSGMAEPVSYETLLKTEDLPAEFQQFTLTFVTEDAELDSLEFAYGDSFDAGVYPEVPEKEGCYVVWDKTELEELHFDTVVTAEYVPYVTALSSRAQQEDGRAAFYLEGQFSGGSFRAEQETPRPEDLVGTSIDFWAAVKDYCSALWHGSWPGWSINRDLEEQWSLVIPEDGAAQHTVRYHPADADVEHTAVYVREDGDWNRVETETVGSYLLFAVEGTEAEVAVLSTLPVWWAWLLVLALAAAVLVLLVILVRRIRRRRWTKGTGTASAPARPGAGGRKKRRILLLAGAVVLIAIVAGLLWFRNSDMKKGYDALELLQDLAARRDIGMELNVELEAGTDRLETSAQIYPMEADGTDVTCITQGGMTLYYAGETVYLEDGSAYRVGELLPDYTGLADHLLDVYNAVDITWEQDGDSTLYYATAEGGDAGKLLSLLSPEGAQHVSVGAVEVCIRAEKGAVTSVTFSGSGTAGGETAASVSGVLAVMEEASDRTVPEAVLAAIASGAGQDGPALTGPVLELLSACRELCDRDPFAARAAVSASCGPLTVDEEASLLRVTVSDTPISCIQTEKRALYFSGDTVCSEDGTAVAASDQTAVDYTALLEIALALCQGAEAEALEENDVYTYEITLEGEALERAAYAIVPEAAELDMELKTGSVRIVVEEGAVRSLEIACQGSVHIIAVDAAASIAYTIVCEEAPEDAESRIPDRVIQALTQ